MEIMNFSSHKAEFDLFHFVTGETPFGGEFVLLANGDYMPQRFTSETNVLGISWVAGMSTPVLLT